MLRGIIIGVAITVFGWIATTWLEHGLNAEDSFLIGEIRSGPWYPWSSSNKYPLKDWQKRADDSYLFDGFGKSDHIYIARIKIRNVGIKTANKIRLVLGNGGIENILLFEENSQPQQLQNAKEVLFKPIDPGASATLVVWSIYDLQKEYQFKDWSSYSNLGEIDFRLDNSKEIYIDPLTIFWQEWGFLLFVIIFCGGTGLLIFITLYFNNYIVEVLSSNDRYSEEKLAYEKAPQKFMPKRKRNP